MLSFQFLVIDVVIIFVGSRNVIIEREGIVNCKKG
jgi:hypothetical protein